MAGAEVLPARGAPRGLSDEWAAVLGEVPLFAGLPKRQLRRLGRLAEARRYRPGTRIVWRGERGDVFFVVLDGCAVVRTPAGAEIRLEAGDSFGEMSLLDGGPRSAAVIAETAVLAMLLRRRRFLQLLRREPAVAEALMVELAHRIRTLEAAAER